MKNAFRSGRALLALALILLSPGLEPYAAAAGSFEAGARVSPGAIAAPIAVPGLGAVALPNSAVSLSPNLGAAGAAVSVALPSAAIPGAQAAVPGAAAAAAALPGAAIVGTQAPAAARFSANEPHFVRPANGSAAAGAQGARAVSAQSQLSIGAARIGGASVPSVSLETGKAAQDTIFSGSAELGSTGVPGGVSAGAPRSIGSVLGKSDGLSGEERSEEPRGPQAPRQSLGRSARVGFIAALVPIGLTLGTMFAAQALGYHFHAGYQAPFPQKMTAITAVTSLIAAAFMAPVSEEMIFRGGLMGWLTKLTPESFGATLRFLMPAAASSLVFVAFHELSDPVLFATRFVHSMILSYAFHKEGYTGSMFAHGFFNGLLFMPVLLSVLLPGTVATIATLALTPLSIGLGIWAVRKVMAERADKKSGRLVAYRVAPWQALLLAAALMAGFFFIMPNLIWPVGALGWLGYAIKRWKTGER